MNQQLQTTQKDSSQLACNQHTTSLVALITQLASNDPQAASDSRMQLTTQAVKLIPRGEVDFAQLPAYPLIKTVEAEIGLTATQTILVALITNFCQSFNVVRNMSEDQIIECAIYLLDECLDFTIEDYVIMFTLGKRRKLGNILDHIDINVVANIHLEYLAQRQRAFRAIQEAKKKEQVATRERGKIEYSPATVDAFEAVKKFTASFIEKEKTDYLENRRKSVAEQEQKMESIVDKIKNSDDPEAKEVAAKIAEQLKQAGVPESIINEYWNK